MNTVNVGLLPVGDGYLTNKVVTCYSVVTHRRRPSVAPSFSTDKTPRLRLAFLGVFRVYTNTPTGSKPTFTVFSTIHAKQVICSFFARKTAKPHPIKTGRVATPHLLGRLIVLLSNGTNVSGCLTLVYDRSSAHPRLTVHSLDCRVIKYRLCKPSTTLVTKLQPVFDFVTIL